MLKVINWYTLFINSSAIFHYQPIGNYQIAGSYQPSVLCVLSQDVACHLYISCAILNFQPITNMSLYQTVANMALQQTVANMHMTSYLLIQDVTHFVTISGAIFNY